MYSKFLLLLAALVAATLWFGCDIERMADPHSPNGVGSVQVVSELPNEALRFFTDDTVGFTVTVIVLDNHGQPFPYLQVDISLSDPYLGVIEYFDLLQDTTNSVGRINCYFRTFAHSGEQVITATAGGRTDSMPITMIEVPRPLSGFTLASDRPHDRLTLLRTAN
ncbi:MAG: hypothetical protein IPP40_18030 [bacterium]|nr:hypothetical protein [bacterium]